MDGEETVQCIVWSSFREQFDAEITAGEELTYSPLNKLFERRLLAIYATTVVSIGITVGVLLSTVFVGLV